MLDEEAVKNRSRLKIIIKPQNTPVPGLSHSYSNLQADFGAADGSIHGCGSNSYRVLKIQVTKQMISYPSWLRVSSVGPVEVLVIDINGNNLVETITISPWQKDFYVKWIEETR